MIVPPSFSIRFDPWPSDMGAEIAVEGAPIPDIVDTTVEDRPWHAVVPSPGAGAAAPPEIVFVDGVRRVEVRIVGQRDGGPLFHGAFGAYARRRGRSGSCLSRSRARHVQITRIDPEVFTPPTPGSAAVVVRDEAFQRALYFDRMERKVAVGLTRTGEPVFANLEFLDGTRGAHASISGISGVATKTSYASFLLYSIFHSRALGLEAANAKALIFNVKGEDLLWLDHGNIRIDERARGDYQRLGLPVGAFQSVGLYAPARRGTSIAIPDTGTRQLGVSPYRWTLGELARQRLLRFAFADADDARAQVSFVIDRVETALYQAARSLAPDAPHVTLDGTALRSFDELVDLLDGPALERVVGGRAASGTLDAFRRRLHAAAQHLAHLVRDSGDDGGPPRRIEWRDHQVTVVDIHRLHAVAQMFVVGALVKRAMDDKEAAGASRPLLFVVLDELNKYAPRTGWSPLADLLLDVAERGRSLGVSLLGAQQTASEVERRVVANAALRVAGRLDAAEAERGEYGWLTRVARQRAAMLQPGSLIVAQPEIPTPILLRFPFPCWATRKSEAGAGQPGASGDHDLFDRMGEP